MILDFMALQSSEKILRKVLPHVSLNALCGNIVRENPTDKRANVKEFQDVLHIEGF